MRKHDRRRIAPQPHGQVWRRKRQLARLLGYLSYSCLISETLDQFESRLKEKDVVIRGV